ncbi:tyrosine-type recombinase/integrase [Mesorhizobium australicum]|uniref:tyrosine-type recombinase/integrase n=1 Tax=Mesorhizobium australicum TaxID=536018 RepID=UPI003337B7F5
MSLSDLACKNAKSKGKPYRLADGDGLYLLVQKNGSKLWQLRYRYLEKENILSFGKYPLVSLLDARGKRDDAKRSLIAGINPSTKRKEEKIAAIAEARTTFGLIAEEYVTRMEERDAAAATTTKTKWLLKDLASPLAKRPIKEITAAEILQLLQKVERSGRRETARRLRGVMGASSGWRLSPFGQRPTQPCPSAVLSSRLKPMVVPLSPMKRNSVSSSWQSMNTMAGRLSKLLSSSSP